MSADALAVAAKAAVPAVRLTGWNPTAISTTSLLVLAIITLTGIVAKNGPKWWVEYREGKKQTAETEARERAAMEAREDAEQADKERRERALETRIESMERRIASTEERALKAETAVMHLTGAATIMMATLRSVSPDNPAIDQARDLIEMAVASGGDSVFAKSLSRLAQVKGVGE